MTEEAEYRNAEGNHLGSWVARVNLDYDDWGIAVYGNHFFEDHSALKSTHIALVWIIITTMGSSLVGSTGAWIMVAYLGIMLEHRFL